MAGTDTWAERARLARTWGKQEFWLGQYEGTKPPLLGRHTRLQDNMKTGLKYMRCESVDWTKLAQHGEKYDSTSMIQKLRNYQLVKNDPDACSEFISLV